MTRASSAAAGEIHAVVGENGSGKSTLLGIASGVLAARRRASSRSRQPSGDGLRARGAGARAGHGLPDVLRGARALGGREPVPRGAADACGPPYGADGRGPRATLARVRPRHRPATPARASLVARRAADARGRQGAARRSRRCCCSTSRPPRSGRARSSGCTRSSSTLAARRASASSTSATGCPRCSSVANRVTVLRDGVSQGTFDAPRHVRGGARRADDRAPARARVPGPHRRGRARRCCSTSSSCAATASGRST